MMPRESVNRSSGPLTQILRELTRPRESAVPRAESKAGFGRWRELKDAVKGPRSRTVVGLITVTRAVSNDPRVSCV